MTVKHIKISNFHVQNLGHLRRGCRCEQHDDMLLHVRSSSQTASRLRSSNPNEMNTSTRVPLRYVGCIGLRHQLQNIRSEHSEQNAHSDDVCMCTCQLSSPWTVKRNPRSRASQGAPPFPLGAIHGPTPHELAHCVCQRWHRLLFDWP